MNLQSSEIVIYPDRKKTLYYFINFLIFSLLGIWMVFQGGVAIIPGLVISFLLLPGSIFHAHRLFLTPPALVINSSGLYDNTSVISIGKIAWEEIEDIRGGEYIHIYPVNRDHVISRQPFWKKAIFILFRIGKPQSPFLMPTQCLRGESSEIFHTIYYYMTANTGTLN